MRNLKDDLITALIEEIDLQKDYLAEKSLSTVYFGGGSPSILDAGDLEKIFSAIGSRFSLEENVEITLEANPDDLSANKLHELRLLGVNRLSIGIQTFNDAYLRYLNRAHDAAMALRCVADARKAGFRNISIDLIYAIKEARHNVLYSDLETAMSLDPEHVSAYCLTIEPKTTFGNWLKKEKIKPVDEEYAAKEFEVLLDFLEKHRYEQYEISNFARDEYYSRHNSNYWRNIPYLGIGPSAHSFNGTSRQFNVANNANYIKAIKKGIVPFELDALDVKNRANETIMTGLRTKWGCNLLFIKERFGYDLLVENRKKMGEYIGKKLIVVTGDTIYLTRGGKLLADEIAADLFWV